MTTGLAARTTLAPTANSPSRLSRPTPISCSRCGPTARFLGRAVRYLVAECGIRQFLDVGTGIPAADNTHEVAQHLAPDSRVVYVDNDRCKSGCAHARWTGQAA